MSNIYLCIQEYIFLHIKYLVKTEDINIKKTSKEGYMRFPLEEEREEINDVIVLYSQKLKEIV